MPGWYTHMEVAKQAVDRLRAGTVPSDFADATRAKGLGDIAHKWRNYLALGSIGPDIFYLLPDFTSPLLRDDVSTIVYWVRDKWDVMDKLFMHSWNQYARPAVEGQGAILDQVSGGVLREIGNAEKELASAMMDMVVDVVAHLWDWFGLFGSGVSAGYSNKEFFWSDMFHYRETYRFARRLFLNAQDSQQIPDQDMRDKATAFAIGWMCHCATDVAGHPFVNAKVGGPWRLHWQRHHLVENHIDAKIYDTQHNGMEPYGELDTACLHFRLAFRHRNDGEYAMNNGAGADDAPAYDYFSGFPSYDTTNSNIGDINRETFFDMDSGDLNEDFCNYLINTMKDVYYKSDGVLGPEILRCSTFGIDPGPPRVTTGRPNIETLQNTYSLLYDFVKSTSTSGYSPAAPSPPPVFNDHRPPPFPGPNEDAQRGTDPGEQPNQVIEAFIALYAFLRWLVDFGEWLATLPIAIANDLISWPARELLYFSAVAPLYSLYIAMRQPLVLSGFLHPKHNEISTGLVRLGVSTGAPLADLVSALSSVGATMPESPPTTEPSGRLATSPATVVEVDKAYPRAIIQDLPTAIMNAVNYAVPTGAAALMCDLTSPQPSEFLRPWRYPARNNAGQTDSSEMPMSFPGPWMQGQSAEVLMGSSPGDPTARRDFESAKDPGETAKACEKHFPAGRHMGDPVDYSTYLIGRLTQPDKDAPTPPDFNLDSDRGYAYQCWDWLRSCDEQIASKDNCKDNLDNTVMVNFDFPKPTTVPEGFCNWTATPRQPVYDPTSDLKISYSNDGKHCNSTPHPEE
jgi:hypothetical protein